MMRCLRLRRLLLITACLLLSLSVGQCTNIKWTPGIDSDDTDAKTAPRSQRYWDKHGIQRPEYAKTDAEVASERNGGPASVSKRHGTSMSWTTMASAMLVIGAALALYRQKMDVSSKGNRLNGTTTIVDFVTAATRGTSEEEEREKARQARLERFRDSIKQE